MDSQNISPQPVEQKPTIFQIFSLHKFRIAIGLTILFIIVLGLTSVYFIKQNNSKSINKPTESSKTNTSDAEFKKTANLMKDSLNKLKNEMLSVTPVPTSKVTYPTDKNLYPYYYSDNNGVWRKNSIEELAVLIYSSSSSPKDNKNTYLFKVITSNLIVTTHMTDYIGEPDLFECDYNNSLKKANCQLVDKVHVFGSMLISLIPGETSYVYLAKAPDKQSWLGTVYAQVPYSVEVKKRNYESKTIENIAEIEQQVGCGGASWHSLYYHGYHQGILVTSNKLILLQLGCEGYSGDGSQYVIDINQKKLIPGTWDFISPTEIDGGLILFHRIPELWNHENKPETHVFYTVPINDLTKETKLFDFGPDKYVSDILYDHIKKQLYIAYIYSPSRSGSDPFNSIFDLRIAVSNPFNPTSQPKDIYSTQGYFINDLSLVNNQLKYTLTKEVPALNKNQPLNSTTVEEKSTYLFDTLTNVSNLQASSELIAVGETK